MQSLFSADFLQMALDCTVTVWFMIPDTGDKCKTKGEKTWKIKMDT